MTAPKVTPYAPIDPDLGVDELRLLARRYQVERDVARAGERAATAMAADVAARVNGALEAYRVEVEAAMRDYCRLYDERVAEVAGLRARVALFDQLYSDRQAELEGQRDAAEVALSAARPVLAEAAAREAVERTWNETGGGPREMHDAFTALLLRVAGPVTAGQASMAAAFDAVKEGACECDPALPSSQRCDGAWVRCNRGIAAALACPVEAPKP